MPALPQQLEPYSLDEDRWLDAAAAALTEAYLAAIRTIPRLTEKGAVQLNADVDYLCNVLSALSLTPSPQLSGFVAGSKKMP